MTSMIYSPVALAGALVARAQAEQRHLLVQASATGSAIAYAKLPGR